MFPALNLTTAFTRTWTLAQPRQLIVMRATSMSTLMQQPPAIPFLSMEPTSTVGLFQEERRMFMGSTQMAMPTALLPEVPPTLTEATLSVTAIPMVRAQPMAFIQQLLEEIPIMDFTPQLARQLLFWALPTKSSSTPQLRPILQ